MKRFILFTITILSGTITIAQNQQNTLPTSGNIGIGTTSPNCKLEVVGEARVNGKTVLDSSLFVKDSARFENRVSIDRELRVTGESVFRDRVKVRDDIRINGTTRMKGNAFVEGNFRFKGLADSTTTDDRFLIIRPNGNVRQQSFADLSQSLYSTDCIPSPNGTFPSPAWLSAPGQGAGILYTGVSCPAKVGIGIALPQASLDVNGFAIVRSRLAVGFQNGQTADAIIHGRSNFNPNFDLIKLENANTAMIFTSEGNLGVGTNNPQGLLHVSNAGNELNYTNTGRLGIGTSTPNGMLHLLNTNLSGNDKMIIIEGANGVDFEVRANGHLYAREVQVRLGTFPDYVFEGGYDLMKLQDLREFVKENHHLPNVPSAEEVGKNGIGIGEMQIILLEKVEELHLYVLELEDEKNELQEANKAMTEEMELMKTEIELMRAEIEEIKNLIHD